MVGMLQILTYMLAFYLVVKGVEILQIGLASNRDDRKGVITIGVVALVACVLAAFGFVVMQDTHVLGVVSSDSESSPPESTHPYGSSVPDYTPPSPQNLRAQEAITDAHNKGWAWAEDRKPNSVGDCVELGDPEVRFGCEAWVKAYRN